MFLLFRNRGVLEKTAANTGEGSVQIAEILFCSFQQFSGPKGKVGVCADDYSARQLSHVWHHLAWEALGIATQGLPVSEGDGLIHHLLALPPDVLVHTTGENMDQPVMAPC